MMHSSPLRSTLSLGSLVALLPLVVATGLAAAPPPISLRSLASNLDQPVAITHAGDERLFVTLQDGRVVIWDGAAIRAQPFLDIRGRVLLGSEQGLLSVAFHRRYGENGFFFVNYTDLGGNTVVSRFSVSAGDPNDALEASERVLLRIEQPFSNHNGGQLQFGPDGFLYIGMGDGGSGGDPLCAAQRDNTLLGKMLRLDVDQNLNTSPFYGIPAGNPHAGPGLPLDEIWAKGFRNPWRFSFDRLTGDLFVGDVGQNTREEVSSQPAASTGGENYGWKMLEGTLCTGDSSGCGSTLPGCNSPLYLPPILEYDHDAGDCSVIGGFAYRGHKFPELWGNYLYGDFCAGTLWVAERQGVAWLPFEQTAFAPGLTSFGEDFDGELYLVAGSTLYAIDGPQLPTTCVASSTVLCLNGGRFRVEARYETAQGATGNATAVPLTGDSGYFWFFNEANLELFVKVRNACVDPFDRYWVFAAGLTNVGVRLTVADLEAGRANVYENPVGTKYDAVQDTGAFATCP